MNRCCDDSFLGVCPLKTCTFAVETQDLIVLILNIPLLLRWLNGEFLLQLPSNAVSLFPRLVKCVFRLWLKVRLITLRDFHLFGLCSSD